MSLSIPGPTTFSGTVVYDLRHFEPRVIAYDHARMVSLEE